VTPWDLGKPTPVIQHLVISGTVPKGRVLVPGCGMVNCTIPFTFMSVLLFSDTIVSRPAHEPSSRKQKPDQAFFLGTCQVYFSLSSFLCQKTDVS
jgi:hypothetical protein